MKSLDTLLAGSSRFTADSDSCGSRTTVAASTLRSRRRDGVFHVEDIVSTRPFFNEPVLSVSFFISESCFISQRAKGYMLCARALLQQSPNDDAQRQ